MKAFKRILTALLCLPLALPLLARGAEPEPALLTRLDALDRVPALAGLTSLPEPSGPGARGSQVLWLQQVLIALMYLPEGAADGVYTLNTARAVQAFQRDAGLRVTGVADADTLRLLFSRPDKVPGRTHMPLWYGGGSSLIPWGARFEVKDVRTGIIFTCVRMMGESHLDAEPLTQEDSARMKQAYGGAWSWDRRPVLLFYRGEVYAASMNGMPHGYRSNPDSGMGGHFCIHFAFARGDSSQRVDSDHLQAALEAARTQWEDPGTDLQAPGP